MMIIIIIIIIVADCCVFFAKVCCLIFSCGDEKNTQQSTPGHRPVRDGRLLRPRRLEEQPFWRRSTWWKSATKAKPSHFCRCCWRRKLGVGCPHWATTGRGWLLCIFFAFFASLLLFVIFYCCCVYFLRRQNDATYPPSNTAVGEGSLAGRGRKGTEDSTMVSAMAGRSVGRLVGPSAPSRLEESPFWRRSACWQSAAKATPSSAPNAAMTPVSGCGGEWCGGEDRAAAAMVRGSVGCCIFCWLVFFVRARRPLLRERTCTCAPKSALCSNLQWTFFSFRKFCPQFLTYSKLFISIFSITFF